MRFKSSGLQRVMALCTAVVLQAAGWSEDWPGWRGPQRTDVSTESNLLKQWPAEGPPPVWLFRDAGVGYSGPAIVGGRLYTMGAHDGTTSMLCLNANDGKELWRTEIGKAFINRWGDGPRSTPFVQGDFVFALTGEGDIVCCRCDDGERSWQRNMTEFGGKVPAWGYSESVLVDDQRLICTPGGEAGTMIALDSSNGNLLWQSEEIADPAHYASAITIEVGGEKQYVQLTKSSLFGVAADSGELRWRSDFDGRIAVIPTPIFSNGQLYITAGYGVGCQLIEIANDEPKVIYANKTMKNHHGGVILIGDHLFGHSDGVGWVCQQFEDGELVWKEKDKLGKGAIGYADGQLYLVSETDGEVVMIQATDSWREQGRFTLSPQTKLRKPAGRIWTHPVISGGKLFLRDQDLVYCYDVSAK